MENTIFWILSAVVIIGAVVYYLKQKKETPETSEVSETSEEKGEGTPEV